MFELDLYKAASYVKYNNLVQEAKNTSQKMSIYKNCIEENLNMIILDPNYRIEHFLNSAEECQVGNAILKRSTICKSRAENRVVYFEI
jgi:hypothetical protein